MIARISVFGNGCWFAYDGDSLAREGTEDTVVCDCGTYRKYREMLHLHSMQESCVK
jgi:hypothetical protein